MVLNEVFPSYVFVNNNQMGSYEYWLNEWYSKEKLSLIIFIEIKLI